MREEENMDRSKIDFKKIKIAIFDFDGTLALHQDEEFARHRRENKEYYLNYYTNAYLYPETFYETIEPCEISVFLQNIIEYFKQKGVKIYCLSGMRFSFHQKAKEYFVHKYYSDTIEVIQTRPQESKVDAVEIMKRIHNCDYNEILFIDDIEEMVTQVRDMGIHAFLPGEIEVLIKESKITLRK